MKDVGSMTIHFRYARSFHLQAIDSSSTLPFFLITHCVVAHGLSGKFFEGRLFVRVRQPVRQARRQRQCATEPVRKNDKNGKD